MSHSANMVPLGKLGKIISGSTPNTNIKDYWNGDIPWITPADLTNHEGIYYKGSLRKITKAGYNSCSARMLPPGSIIFSSRAPIGHCAVTAFPLCTNQGFKSIVPNENLDAVYGFFALTFFTPQIIARGRGATFLEVSKEIIEDFPIPLPPFPKQKRLAAILEKADRLRRLRRYARELSDTYLQSVFLEMFGDLRTNPTKYPIIPLGKVCDVRDGTHESPSYVQKGYPLVTSKNLVNGYVDLHDANFISKEDYVQINKRSKVDKGDILMPMIGTIGNPVLVDHIPNYAIKNVALIKFVGGSPRSLYIRELLRGYYFDFITSKSSRGGTQQFIALDDIRNFPIPSPSDEEQSKFNQIIQKFEHLQSQQREAERQAEHLFQTLLHKAFNGELS